MQIIHQEAADCGLPVPSQHQLYFKSQRFMFWRNVTKFEIFNTVHIAVMTFFSYLLYSFNYQGCNITLILYFTGTFGFTYGNCILISFITHLLFIRVFFHFAQRLGPSDELSLINQIQLSLQDEWFQLFRAGLGCG